MPVDRNKFTVNSLTISPADEIKYQGLICDYGPTHEFSGELTINSKISYDEIAKAFGVGNLGKDPSEICDIYHNPKKHTTVVVFEYRKLWAIERRKVKVKLDAKDPDNIYMAVASAVVIYKYGTNSQFKAHISRSVDKDIYGDALDAVYMIAAQLEVSEIFGTWDKFKELVDDKIKISE